MKRVLTLAFLIILPLASVAVHAAETTMEGTIQGLMCVTFGKICPVEKEDPLAASENVFVLLTEGKDYYFIPNLDRIILARHINEKVRIKGEVNSKFKSINAMSLEYFKDGKWKTGWDKQKEEDITRWYRLNRY